MVLGRRLSRIQIETIRIGDLESFNDRQSILADQDHIENLRNSAISQFLLPMNEKLLKSAKCHLKSRELKNQKMRIIILTNDILFDPEFYGPEVSPKSCLVPIRRLHRSQCSSSHAPVYLNTCRQQTEAIRSTRDAALPRTAPHTDAHATISVSPREQGQRRASGESASANLAIDLRLWPGDEDSDLATYVITFKDEGACSAHERVR